MTRALFAVSIAAGGWYWARRAWSAARLFALDINTLMLIAVAGAIAIGEWSEAATVTFLFALAQWIESRNMERARLAIRALMELAPGDALVHRDGRDVRVPIDSVAIGDVLVVRPGEKIPLDGAVAAGESEVNQAPITGESLPVGKGPGDEVFAGTINGHGALDGARDAPAAATRRWRGSSTWSSMPSRNGRPSQTFVERFARIYTPAVVGLAAVVAVVPPLAFAEPWSRVGVSRARVPGDLVPVRAGDLDAGRRSCRRWRAPRRKGVLIKGGRHLEMLGRVRCVAFDKTGTLTHGTPAVVDVRPVAPWTRADVLRLAGSLESRSEHPIGARHPPRGARRGRRVGALRAPTRRCRAWAPPPRSRACRR